jgi:O-antigen/teichoic acid export membrane protein
MEKSGGLNRILRQTGLYAVGNIAVKAGGLILAPLYLNTALLSKEAYGHLVLLEATAQIIVPVAGLGLATGMLKFMSEPESDRAIPFTALVMTTALAAATFAVLWWAAPALARFIMDDPSAVAVPRLMAGYAALKVIGTLPYIMLRVRERAGLYAAGMIAEWMVLVVGVYYFLAVLHMGLEGVLLAYVLSAATSVAMMNVFMLFHIEWRLRGRLVRNLLRFGVPLVLSSFASLFLNVGDRYILKWLTDAETVAVYGWASRLGGTINMLLVQSFQLAFTVVGLKMVGTGDLSLHRRTFRHFTIWSGWAVLGLSLLSYDVTMLLVKLFGVDPYYLNADPMVLPIALGFMGYGIYIVVNNVLYATALTHVISMNVLVAACANAAFNLVMIPWMGAYGAALATTMAYALLAWMSARVAERRIHVGYPWKTVSIVVGLVAGLWVVSVPTYAWETVPRLLARLILISVYMPVILWIGLYNRTDLLKGIEVVRGRLLRR